MNDDLNNENFPKYADNLKIEVNLKKEEEEDLVNDDDHRMRTTPQIEDNLQN